MADWNALHRYIKSEYKIASDDLNSVKLIFNLDNNRTQLVVVEKAGEVGDSEWAVISTAVCDENQINPKDALIRSSQMVVGGLALVDGGPVIFRHSIRLAELDPGEFEEPLRVAAVFGDKLEQELSGADSY
ncbi:MAG: hypothetical protein WB507_08730 [Solirubrobacterales bacterium]